MVASALTIAHASPDEWVTSPRDRLPLDISHALRDGLAHVAVAQPLDLYPGETPVEGLGAVNRWLALYDCAQARRTALRPGDDVGVRQAHRAIRSLFLYEHQLTSTTRRKAREALWRRDGADALPDFTVRAGWSRCRCGRCQRTMSSL